MKELTHIHQDKVEIIDQVKIRKNKFLGTLTQHEGHTLYEFDMLTFELRKAEYEKNYIVSFSNSCNQRVNVKPNCYYVSSLNPKNAAKKINRALPHNPCVIDKTNG